MFDDFTNRLYSRASKARKIDNEFHNLCDSEYLNQYKFLITDSYNITSLFITKRLMGRYRYKPQDSQILD